MKTIGIILAAGSSSRFGSDKLEKKLGEKTVLERTLSVLHACDIDELIVVEEGGETRFESLCMGVETASENISEDDFGETLILVHNGANPGVTADEVAECLEAAMKTGGSGVAGKVVDTIRMQSGEGGAGSTPDTDAFEVLDRNQLRAMQTPQCVRLDLLLTGIEEAKRRGIVPTDELQLLDLIGAPYELIDASPTNFKITTPEDLIKMRAVLGVPALSGIGQDSHRFSQNNPSTETLIMGGITIPDHPKLEANSDGDVILHALFNAISSALGGKSISHIADEMCKAGITDSAEYLKVVLSQMKEKGYQIGNVSIALECKIPKIDPIETQLKESLSNLLEISTDRIGITATSGEELTSFGRAEGIQCICTVTLI